MKNLAAMISLAAIVVAGACAAQALGGGTSAKSDAGSGSKARPAARSAVPGANKGQGASFKVSGKVVASKNITDLAGIKIRLDVTGPWQMIGETDAKGQFEVSVPQGKHRLIAYLPDNERFDAGAGHVDVNVTGEIKNLKLQLLPMAMVRVKIVDESGKPLAGLGAFATWRADLSGPGFVSVKPSDAEGMTALFIYPGEKMYVGGLDRSGRLQFKVPKDVKPVRLQDDQVLEMTVTMAASKKSK